MTGETATGYSYYWIAKVETAPMVVATGTYTDALSKVERV